MSVTPADNDPVGDDVYQPDPGLEFETEPDMTDEGIQDQDPQPVQETGYSPLDRPMELDTKGTTVEEQAEGNTISDRLYQEVPDPNLEVEDPLADRPTPVGENAEMQTGDADDVTDAQVDDRRADLGTDGELLDDQVGDVRSGRLVAPGAEIGPDSEGTEVARDIGIDDGYGTAEEAAMHTVDDDDPAGLTTPDTGQA